MKKRFLAGIVAGLLAFVCALPIFGVFNASAEENNASKKLDMYLIAGQSNAAGYSYSNGVSNPETFENVWYAGEADKTLCGSNTMSAKSDYLSSFDRYKRQVTVGLGATANHIGPEYGMAKVLNSRYAGETKAFIFKTAAGGTFLLDNGSGLSAQYGNWYPRSLWPAGYTPNVTQASVGNDPTGILYQLFVTNFEKVYTTLIAEGYQPTIKGMVWMQGESDLPNVSDTYGDTLKAFIQDIRADLTAITGDPAVQVMPFVIGKIAESFQGWWNTDKGPSEMAEMHRQQERMVTELEGVGTVDTDDLIIVEKKENPNDPDVVPGTDVSHYSGADAVELGMRFANKVLEVGGSTLVAMNAINGTLACEFVNEERTKVKFTLAAKVDPMGKQYRLKSFVINNQDVTASVVNGEYVLENAEGLVVAEAEFVEKDKVVVTYAKVTGAGCRYTYNNVYVGEKLSLKVYPSTDYKIEKVTFAGEEMTYNSETGEYEIVVTKAGEVNIEVSGGPNGNTNDNTKKGCGSVIAFNAIAVMLGAAACGLFLKKKEK